MTDFREEAYILEKMEITEDDDDNFAYEEIKDDEEELQTNEESDDDDLNNFEMLKAKTQQRLHSKGAGAESMKTTYKGEAKSKVVEREVVIDDFVRNFLQKFNMKKTLTVFQQEWHEQQKKGTFHDNQIGLITDIENKNARLQEKVVKMRKELAQAKVAAEQAKSTWEKLRKERDFHKTHQTRVNGEKVVITNNIKKVKDLHEQYEERIEEIQKKLLGTMKEKALLKLEKDKLSKRAADIQKQIKEHQEKVSKEIEESHKRQQFGFRASQQRASPAKGKNTPYPEDARPNPFLARSYDDMNPRPVFFKKIDAHHKPIGGFSLHMRKQIVATASDDCTWKVWNMETGENIMTGEGHKEWICAVDFHPLGSHLVTAGGDRCVKIWDFVNSTIAHTFEAVHTQPIWKAKFHDTGDFVLSGGGDGVVKLYDLNSLKVRQQFRSHTDAVNGLNFQPFTNFFVTGSSDKTLSIWDMRTGLTVQTFYGHLNSINDCNFSIGGQFIASCDSDGIVKQWDIRMIQEVMQVDIGNAIALSVAFDKNAKTVFVGASDNEIKAVSLEKGDVVAQLKAHEDTVNGVMVNQENNILYSISSDGTVRSWK